MCDAINNKDKFKVVTRKYWYRDKANKKGKIVCFLLFYKHSNACISEINLTKPSSLHEVFCLQSPA